MAAWEALLDPASKLTRSCRIPPYRQRGSSSAHYRTREQVPAAGGVSVPLPRRSGGLLSYGVDALDLVPRAADYVDCIMRGANPGELAVQAPTKFELVINLKTAKALGLDAPLPCSPAPTS